MKIAIPIDSQQSLGGGFTFARNLTKGLKQLGVEVVQNPLEADIALISGVTMVSKDTYTSLKEYGVKTIVRLDNVPRNSRNRNTGTSRLRSFSQKADEVVYQGEWARWYLQDFIGREGVIIHNGVDQEIFKPEGEKIDFGIPKENLYLFSRFNRDENKRYEQIWYEFQLIHRQNPNVKLILVGKFSPELVEYNFDFFRGEKVDYLGIVNDPLVMAKIYRSCKYMFAPYFCDAYSNTYLEGLMSGIELTSVSMTGGTPELIANFTNRGREYNSLERMALDYKKVFEKVLNN